LHEIVRIIQERSKVPEKVRVRTKQYQITYLDDHRQRLEEAIRRFDRDRLSMLFGQLPGKLKYQALKNSHSKTTAVKTAPSRGSAARSAAKAGSSKSAAAKRGKSSAAKRPVAKRPAAKRRASGRG
jgi:ribosomal protein L12E/L44/L45/RPP1/RPP2